MHISIIDRFRAGNNVVEYSNSVYMYICVYTSFDFD